MKTTFSIAIFLTLNLISTADMITPTTVGGIPKEWIDQKGKDVLGYANFIKSLKLKNIAPEKVLHPHFKVKDGTQNSIPPRYMWGRTEETLRVVDKLSEILDAEVDPFLVAYRSPAYNRAINGRSRSQHLTNRAVRVTFKNVPPQQVAEAAAKLRDAGFFKGGIGLYKHSTHIDTRGHNVDW